MQASHSALSYSATPSTEFRGSGKEGGGEGFHLSPLSFCSDRVVPAADSSELKHETHPTRRLFSVWHLFSGGGVRGLHPTPPARDAQYARWSGGGLFQGQGNRAARTGGQTKEPGAPPSVALCVLRSLLSGGPRSDSGLFSTCGSSLRPCSTGAPKPAPLFQSITLVPPTHSHPCLRLTGSM